MRIKTCDGFTLIEVMVAMVILGIMASGLITLTNQYLQQIDYLADKTVATLVASNALTEVQLLHTWPPTNTQQDITMGNKTWHVTLHAITSPTPDFQRIEASVAYASAPAQPIITLTGFMGKQ